MENNLIQLNNLPSFSWVALDESGSVVGQGKTLEDAEKKAQEQGVTHPSLLKIPPKDAVYVPSAI